MARGAPELRPALHAQAVQHGGQEVGAGLCEGGGARGRLHKRIQQLCGRGRGGGRAGGQAASSSLGGGWAAHGVMARQVGTWLRAHDVARQRVHGTPTLPPFPTPTLGAVVWVYAGQQRPRLPPRGRLHPGRHIPRQRLPQRQQAVAHRLAGQARRQRRQLPCAVLPHRPHLVGAQVCKG